MCRECGVQVITEAEQTEGFGAGSKRRAGKRVGERGRKQAGHVFFFFGL